MLLVSGSALAVFLASFAIYGQETSSTSHDRFSVTLSVTCDDELLRNQIKSYVTRELRDLRDVDVVERAPSRGAVFGIVLMAIKTANAMGVPTGWALSWVVTQRQYELNDAVTSVRGVNTIFVTSALFVGADSDLKQSMAAAVASFDATTLEEIRSFRKH